MSSTPVAPRQQGVSAIIVLLIVLIVLVIGVGTAGALYVAGVFERDASTEATAAAAKPKPKPPIYIPLEPPLVVNFDRNGRMGFLQANIEVMTREPKVQEALAQHAPVIRNNLLLLLSGKTYADVASREGKEQLRVEALAEVNQVLMEHDAGGEADELYFTGFVMQ